MDPIETVPAAEFTRNFGRYRMLAQRRTLAVTSHGTVTGYFIRPEEYEAFRRYQASRQGVDTAALAEDLGEEEIGAIAGSPADARQDPLSALLDADWPAVWRPS
jgi:hypothetical protein